MLTPRVAASQAPPDCGDALARKHLLSTSVLLAAACVPAVAGSLVGTPPSGAKTVVSDYLDLSENMYTTLLSGAEVWLARLMGKNIEGAMSVYHKDLRMAMESDVVAPISGRRSGTDRHPDMPSPPFAGTPRGLGYYSQSAPDTGA
jgi:hypothetical protein